MILRILFITTLCLTSCFCPSTSAIAEEREVKIGLLAALSGPFAQLGTECRDGYELGRKWLAPQDRLKDYHFEFIYGDSLGAGNAAISEFHRFKREKVLAVLSAGSYSAMPINLESLKAKIPHLGVLGHRDFLSQNSYAFQFWPSSEYEGELLAAHACKMGFKKIIAFTAESEYPQSMLNSFSNHISDCQGEIFNNEVNLSTTDFRALITRTRNTGFDAIFANLGLEQIGILARQLRQQNISAPIISNFWAYGRTNLKTAGIEALEGLVFVMPTLQQPKLQLLAKQAGIAEITAPLFTCFTSMVALLRAFKQNDNINSPINLYQTLLHQKEILLPDKALQIKNRLARFPLELMVIRNGQAKRLVVASFSQRSFPQQASSSKILLQ